MSKYRRQKPKTFQELVGIAQKIVLDEEYYCDGRMILRVNPRALKELAAWAETLSFIEKVGTAQTLMRRLFGSLDHGFYQLELGSIKSWTFSFWNTATGRQNKVEVKAIIFSNSRMRTIVNRIYVDRILSDYPNARFFGGSDPEQPIRIDLNGKTVGCVMPIKSPTTVKL